MREEDPETEGGLHRVLRVRDGLAVTIGIVIGVGILRTPGLIAGHLGHPWAILGIWLLGGAIAALSAVVMAEMAAALPAAGGKYVYAREGWGPLAGFVTGWSEVLVTRGFSGAAKTVVIAEYLVLLTGRGSIRFLALAVVLLYLLINLGGLRIGTAFQNISTLFKILVVLAVAAAGLWAGDGSGFTPDPDFTHAALEGSGGLLLAFALAYQAAAFSYYGWEDAAKFSEETRDPGRSLPRILFGGALAVIVLYLLINLAFLSALTPAEMAGAEMVAQEVTSAIFGESAGTLVLIAGLVILLSSLNVNFMGIPRVAYGLARDGLAPRIFTRVNGEGTPVPALLFASAIILSLALTGAFEWLIRFMMLVAIAVDTVMLASIFRLRRLRPDLVRPYRVPGYPWLPALTLALYLLLLLVIVGTQPELALGAGTLLGLLILAGLRTVPRRERRISPGSSGPA